MYASLVNPLYEKSTFRRFDRIGATGGGKFRPRVTFSGHSNTNMLYLQRIYHFLTRENKALCSFFYIFAKFLFTSGDFSWNYCQGIYVVLTEVLFFFKSLKVFCGKFV